MYHKNQPAPIDMEILEKNMAIYSLPTFLPGYTDFSTSLAQANNRRS
jgi:hypothetical protein